ncbi:MAG: flotillin family protein [Symploca sp. SIO2D2]|nr:flotillin family protein [Symploca sp. SIO2D2]
MKPLKISFKIAVLLGVATISAAFGVKNTQGQILPVEPASTVLLGKIPTTTASLQIGKEHLTNQEVKLKVMPLRQVPTLAQAAGGNGTTWIIFVVLAVIAVTASGVVVIGKNEVGIVYKKFAPLRGSLPDDQKFALNGEAGWQAKMLSNGLHFWHWSWLYEVHRKPMVKIPPEQIGLVIANGGAPIPQERMLGKAFECKNFQDGCAFLQGGGEKGQQLAILTTGYYRINTELFTVITTANAAQHGIDPNKLQVYKVAPGKIGIVTTYDGVPTEEIAGPRINGHKKFQDGQKFIDEGGCIGLQEEVIPTGAYKLNPWFVKVKQVPLTEIPPATVGVVISSVGKTPKNGASHDLVEAGYKGTQKEPLYPGKHSINTDVMDVVIVPTNKISLDWSNKPKPPTNYDSQLDALKLRSKDTFAFTVEVTQVIKIDGKDAPQMISHVGSPSASEQQLTAGNSSNLTSTTKYISIKNLVTKVLEPMVSGQFYIAVQDYEALEFRDERRQIQREAADYIESELRKCGVQAAGTFIKEIDLPNELEKPVTDAKIAQIKTNTLKEQQVTEEERRKLVYAQALTDFQKDLVKHQQGVQIADLQAQAQRHRNFAKAEATREDGMIQAEIMQAIINVVGPNGYLDVEKIKQLANIKLPDVWVSNSDGNSSGLIQALIASVLHPEDQQHPLNQLIGVSANLPKQLKDPLLPQSQINCPNCGAANPESNKYCNNCGNKLNQQLLDFSPNDTKALN